MARPKLEDRPSTVNRSERPKRTPINGYRDILSVTGQDPEFHYCWVNEEKVPRFEQAGYEFVTHDVIVGDAKINTASQIGGKVSLAVGTTQTGSILTAYLMRVLQEYYVQDMAEFDSQVDEKDAAMKAEFAAKRDGRYGEVEISHSRPVGKVR